MFFQQHAALETFYYLGSPSDAGVLEPFLDSPHEHVQVSAVRALSRIDTLPAKRRMVEFLTSTGKPPAKIQAVVGLRRQKARDLVAEIEAIVPQLEASDSDLDVELMDPRIGTRHWGSPKAAAMALLAEWDTLAPK
jgi:hypothetical protein